MSDLEFRDGKFSVAVCENGHVSLQIIDGGAVKVVSVMSQVEAAELAVDLLQASGLRFDGACPVCA